MARFERRMKLKGDNIKKGLFVNYVMSYNRRGFGLSVTGEVKK